MMLLVRVPEVGRPPRDHVVFVWDTTELGVAAPDSVAADRWRQQLDEFTGRIGPRFARVETRRTATRMLTGMISELPTKNCWTLAEYAGDRSPDAMQHLLSSAVIDDDGLREDLRDYVIEHVGEVDATLVVDETGDVKKGSHTVGVQRQYTGTAGRIENSQVAVYLTYATAAGHAFLDNALYLPRSWTTDPARCQGAGVPADVVFATKPALAKRMIIGALDAGVPARWVTGDEVYGSDPQLRAELESRSAGYVFAVARDHRLTTATGRVRADILAKGLPKRAWQQLSAGDGAKGPRVYDWAWIETGADDDKARPGHRWLVIRRNQRTGELAYYRCWNTEPVPLARLVKVAGRRWSTEENFQTAKTLTGLDQHQVRCWRSWHRWTLLAILAHAFLTVAAITARDDTHRTELIALTRNEIRHLFTTLVLTPVRAASHRTHWSHWRRRHQYRARRSHYQRRSRLTP
ncbi:IS701 family transposase [Nocardia sp. CC227C]|uniref:IS701 family transposase n=1 Tax=Nocardia sp. CC227C TaxID=3044562 RepID=UPI00278C42B3|nr:IS701 family transposase [Nocardia sp. CC227C]